MPATTPRSWLTITSGETHLLLQRGEQFEDLCLRRDVERGGRFRRRSTPVVG